MLPTLDAARAVDPDLPSSPPGEERALAALTLAARLQRRDVRVQRMEVAARRVERLPREAPPPPSGFAEATHSVLAGVAGHHPCSLCGVRPGLSPCPYCALMGCYDCKRTGWVTCTACDGAREIALADVRIIHDHEVVLRATYAPTVSLELDACLRDAIDDAVDPPDALLFDLERSSAFAPYREADTPADDEAFGHRFEDALERARAGVAALRAVGEVVREELRAWSRPFLLLRWPDQAPVVVLADGSGAVQVLRVG